MSRLYLFIVVFSLKLLVGCDSSLAEEDSIDNETNILSEQEDSIVVNKKYFLRNIKQQELMLGPEISDVENEELRLLLDEEGVKVFESGEWRIYDDIKSVRDRGGSMYYLLKGKEYLVKDGELRVLFESEFLMYNYNLLTNDNTKWNFSAENVYAKFKKGTYRKGEQFAEFATIDTIYCNDHDFSIFNNTDVEIDLEIIPDKLYNGKLIYIREVGGKSSSGSWKRNNFKFIISE